MNRPYVRLKAGKIPAFKPANGTDYVGAKGDQTEIVGTMPIGGTNGWALIGLEGKDPRRGIKLSGAKLSFDLGDGVVDAKVQGVDLNTDGGYVLNGNDSNKKFTPGVTTSALINELVFEHCALSGSANFYNSYKKAVDDIAVPIGLRLRDIVFLQRGAAVICIRGNFYDLELTDLDIDTDAMDTADQGWLYLECGNAKVTNFRRQAAYGYDGRIFQVIRKGIANNQDTIIKNSLGWGTSKYGNWGIRGDSSANSQECMKSGNFTMGDVTLQNVTGVHKKSGGYVTNLLVAGGMVDETGKKRAFNLINCLALDGYTDRQDLLINDDSGGNAVFNISNSFGAKSAVPVPAGWLDQNLIAIPGTPAAQYQGYKGSAAPAVPALPVDPSVPVTPVTPVTPGKRTVTEAVGQVSYSTGNPDTYRYKVPAGKTLKSAAVHMEYTDGTHEDHAITPKP